MYKKRNKIKRFHEDFITSEKEWLDCCREMTKAVMLRDQIEMQNFIEFSEKQIKRFPDYIGSGIAADFYKGPFRDYIDIQLDIRGAETYPRADFYSYDFFYVIHGTESHTNKVFDRERTYSHVLHEYPEINYYPSIRDMINKGLIDKHKIDRYKFLSKNKTIAE